MSDSKISCKYEFVNIVVVKAVGFSVICREIYFVEKHMLNKYFQHLNYEQKNFFFFLSREVKDQIK